MVWELERLERLHTPLQAQDGFQHTVHGDTESGETVLMVLYCPYNVRQLASCLHFAVGYSVTLVKRIWSQAQEYTIGIFNTPKTNTYTKHWAVPKQKSEGKPR